MGSTLYGLGVLGFRVRYGSAADGQTSAISIMKHMGPKHPYFAVYLRIFHRLI